MDKTNDHPTWFLKFLQDVQDMRDAQNNYFSQRTETKLKISKAKESQVDIFLAHAMKQGLIEHKKPPVNNQPSMF